MHSEFVQERHDGIARARASSSKATIQNVVRMHTLVLATQCAPFVRYVACRTPAMHELNCSKIACKSELNFA